LQLFGGKGQARARARRPGVPVMAVIDGPTALAQAREFMASPAGGTAVLVKAVAGGGLRERARGQHGALPLD
jgi:biotin carboxylase